MRPGRRPGATKGLPRAEPCGSLISGAEGSGGDVEQEQVWGDDGIVEEAEPYGGHPLLATLIGCVCLLLTAGLPVRDAALVTGDPSEAAAYKAGQIVGAMIVGIIVWAIAYAVTLRRASPRWKFGSLAILVVLSLLVGLYRLGGREAALRSDARAAAEQMKQAVAGEGRMEAPIAGGSGPLSQMMAALLNTALADQQAFDRAAAESGVYRLLDLTSLRRDDPALRGCDRIDGLVLSARTQAGRYPDHLDAARAAGARHVQDGALRADELDSFIAGAANNELSYRRNWTITGDWASEAAALCRLLATRPWSRSGSEIVFAADRDAAAANGHLQRINALAAQQQRLQDEGRSRVRRDLERLKL